MPMPIFAGLSLASSSSCLPVAVRPSRTSFDLSDLAEEHTSNFVSARHAAYYRRMIRWYGFEETTREFADLDRVSSIWAKAPHIDGFDFLVDVHLGGKLSEHLGLVEIAAGRQIGGLFLPMHSQDSISVVFSDGHRNQLASMSRRVETNACLDAPPPCDSNKSAWRSVHWPWNGTSDVRCEQLGLDLSGLLWLLTRLADMDFLVRRIQPPVHGLSVSATVLEIPGCKAILSEQPLKKCRLHDCCLISDVVAQTTVLSPSFREHPMQMEDAAAAVVPRVDVEESSSSSSSSSDSIASTCVACLDRKGEMISNGCLHICLCYPCSQSMTDFAPQGPPSCPLCQAPLTNLRRLSDFKI